MPRLTRPDVQAELDRHAEPLLAFDDSGVCVAANRAAGTSLGLPAGEAPERVGERPFPADALAAGWRVRGRIGVVAGESRREIEVTSRPSLESGMHVLAIEPRRFARADRPTLAEAALEHLPLALVVVDDDRRVLVASAAARRVLGLHEEDRGTWRLQGEDLAALWPRLPDRGDVAVRLPLPTEGGVRTLALRIARGIQPGFHAALVGGRTAAARRRLSSREREVLAGLADGQRTEEIAARLVLSADTVRTHVRNALRRLGAHSRAHAVAIAVREGEIDL